MIVRRERPSDRDAVAEVHRAAFAHGRPHTFTPPGQEPIEVDLVDALRDADDLVSGCCFVAEVQGEVVGHVAVSRGTLDGAQVLLALGPIGVAPAHQGAGVGAALMHAAIGASEALGEKGIVLLGHPEYYTRFGFVPAVDVGVRPPADWGREFFMVRRLTAWPQTGLAGVFGYPAAFGV